MNYSGNQKVHYLNLSEIEPDWDSRARGVSESGVESILTSIEENGFTTPISVRRKGRGDKVSYVLIAGGHRLTAAIRLGWETIPALVFADITDIRAKFMELADNLAGKRLDALEEASFLTEWQRMFLEAHPEARRGVAGGRAQNGQPTPTLELASFVRSAAEATGYSESKIYSRVALGKALSDEDFRALRSAPNKVRAGDLDALLKVRDPKIRQKAISQFNDGKTASLGEAIKKQKPKKKPADPDRDALQKLAAAWKRASPKVRRKFVSDEGVALMNLLRELDGEL